MASANVLIAPKRILGNTMLCFPNLPEYKNLLVLV